MKRSSHKNTDIIWNILACLNTHKLYVLQAEHQHLKLHQEIE